MLLAGASRVFETDAELDAQSRTALHYEELANFLAGTERWRGLGAGSMIVSRFAFEAVGGFDELLSQAEDTDLSLRLGTCACFVDLMAPVTVGFRLHDNAHSAEYPGAARALLKLVIRERRGDYPGDVALQQSRRRLLGRHARSAVLNAWRSGAIAPGCSLYWATLPWQCAERRWRFVLGAPVLSSWRFVRQQLMA